MTISGKATNSSHCSLLCLNANNGTSNAKSNNGLTKVTILNN